MSFATVIGLLGWLVTLFAAAMLVPAAVALGYGETGAAAVFAGTAAVTLFFGVGMVFATQGARRALRRGGDFLLAVIAWPVLAAFGAAPLLLLDAVAVPTDAFFEAMSGLTTTGATVMSDLEAQSRGVVLWRAWLQWLGGLGTIVLAVSVLPMIGVGGMQAFHSAMPHGDHATVEARITRSAVALSWMYGALTVACAIALRAAGVPGFDAVAHAMSTLSTGGFSTRDGGVAALDNAAAEAVMVGFMVAGALNVTLYWALLNGRFAALRDDPELAALVVLGALAALAATLVLHFQGGLAADVAVRRGVFAAVSLLTTTGFVNDVAAPWPTIMPILFLALILLGGCSGSTAGGIKMMRVVLALKQGRRELARLAHPHVVAHIRYARRTVPEAAIQSLWSFFILFMVAFAVLAVVLAAFGLDGEGAVAMALATLTNAGAGLPLITGDAAGYALLPAAAKWVLCAGMLLGRLELVAVVAVLTPMFWKR